MTSAYTIHWTNTDRITADLEHVADIITTPTDGPALLQAIATTAARRTTNVVAYGRRLLRHLSQHIETITPYTTIIRADGTPVSAVHHWITAHGHDTDEIKRTIREAAHTIYP